MSGKLPQVMSTEAALVGSRDYESLNIKKIEAVKLSLQDLCSLLMSA